MDGSQSLLDRISRWRPDRQLRNLGWFGLAEACVRISRILTVVVLARWAHASDVGTAALALMLFELVRAVGVAGLGQLIVRAEVDELARTCDAVRRAAWTSSVVMLLVLAAGGLAMAPLAAVPDWMALLGCLGLVYLLTPLGLVQEALIQRTGRLKRIAAVSAATVIVDCCLTAALAVAGLGAWAIVLPKLLVAPLWVGGMRRLAPGVPRDADRRMPLADVYRFVVPVMGSEALSAARQQADKLLVGLVLGPSAIGMYYFVYNSGVGLSLTLTTALAATVYPHLAEVASRPEALRRRMDQLMRFHGVAVSALIALQAALIPVYVPLLLGSRWGEVPPLAALLCLGALTKPAFDIAGQALRAAGATRYELVGSFLFTIISLGSFCVALYQGLASGVAALGVVSLVGQAIFAIVARRHIRSLSVADTLRPTLPLRSPA